MFDEEVVDFEFVIWCVEFMYGDVILKNFDFDVIFVNDVVIVDFVFIKIFVG